MKLFYVAKDGGPDSSVTGYWLIEAKAAISALILEFDGRSRDAFHNHAFSALSWVLKGGLTETMLDGEVRRHRPSLKPIWTPREVFHRVDSDEGKTWVVSFRGPWVNRWKEWWPKEQKFVNLSSGRKIEE